MTWIRVAARDGGKHAPGRSKPPRPGIVTCDYGVPTSVLLEAKAAFSDRQGLRIARLVHDSLFDADGRADDHRLRFVEGLRQIELHLRVRKQAVTVSGVARFDRPTEVVLRPVRGDWGLRTALVEGMFCFTLVPRGLVRLSFVDCAGTDIPDQDGPLCTDWFRL